MKPSKQQAAMSAFHWREQTNTTSPKPDLHRHSNKPLKPARIMRIVDAHSTVPCNTWQKAVVSPFAGMGPR